MARPRRQWRATVAVGALAALGLVACGGGGGGGSSGGAASPAERPRAAGPEARGPRLGRRWPSELERASGVLLAAAGGGGRPEPATEPVRAPTGR